MDIRCQQPREKHTLMFYLGGLGNYRKQLADEVNAQYQGFAFQPQQRTTA